MSGHIYGTLFRYYFSTMARRKQGQLSCTQRTTNGQSFSFKQESSKVDFHFAVPFQSTLLASECSHLLSSKNHFVSQMYRRQHWPFYSSLSCGPLQFLLILSDSVSVLYILMLVPCFASVLSDLQDGGRQFWSRLSIWQSPFAIIFHCSVQSLPLLFAWSISALPVLSRFVGSHELLTLVCNQMASR